MGLCAFRDSPEPLDARSPQHRAVRDRARPPRLDRASREAPEIMALESPRLKTTP